MFYQIHYRSGLEAIPADPEISDVNIKNIISPISQEPEKHWTDPIIKTRNKNLFLGFTNSE